MMKLLLAVSLLFVGSFACGRQCYHGTLTTANPNGDTNGTSCDSASDCRASFSFIITECGDSVSEFYVKLSDKEVDTTSAVSMSCERIGDSSSVSLSLQGDQVTMQWQYEAESCTDILEMLSTPRGTFQSGQITVDLGSGNLWAGQLDKLNDYEFQCETPSPTPNPSSSRTTQPSSSPAPSTSTSPVIENEQIKGKFVNLYTAFCDPSREHYRSRLQGH